MARAFEHAPRSGEPRPVRHQRDQGVRRVGGQCSGAGETPRAQSRARRRSLGDRVVRGPPPHVVRRRAGARDARADGPLVPRFRQLGHLRHGVLPPLRSDAVRLGQGRAVGTAGAASSSSARRLRSSPASPCTTRKQATSRSSRALPLIERAATDERNFVKKAVSWALRAVGRRNAALNAAAVDVARRLAASESPAARWVGRDAVRELTSALVMRKIAGRR